MQKAATVELTEVDSPEDPPVPIRLPREPEALSYVAAGLLPLPPPLKQELLEEDSTATRLTRVLDHAARGRAEQERLLAIAQSHPGASNLLLGGGAGPRTRN